MPPVLRKSNELTYVKASRKNTKCYYYIPEGGRWSSEFFILAVHFPGPSIQMCATVAKRSSSLWTKSPPPVCGFWSLQWYTDTGQKDLNAIVLRGPWKSTRHRDLPRGRLSPKKSMKEVADGRVTCIIFLEGWVLCITNLKHVLFFESSVLVLFTCSRETSGKTHKLV